MPVGTRANPRNDTQLACDMAGVGDSQAQGGVGRLISKHDNPVPQLGPDNVEDWARCWKLWGMLNQREHVVKSPAERQALGLPEPTPAESVQACAVLFTTLPNHVFIEVEHMRDPHDVVQFVKQKYRGNTLSRMLAWKGELHTAAQAGGETSEAFVERLTVLRDKCSTVGYDRRIPSSLVSSCVACSRCMRQCGLHCAPASLPTPQLLMCSGSCTRLSRIGALLRRWMCLWMVVRLCSQGAPAARRRAEGQA